MDVPASRRQRYERVAAALLIACLVGVVLTVGWHYATTRNVHIDELQNIYSVRLISTYGAPQAADPLELYLVLLGGAVRTATSTFEIVHILRSIFFPIFLAVLGAVAATRRRASALVQATLLILVVGFMPIWRHGIEVRHDTLIALGYAILWQIARRASAKALDAPASFIAGLVAAVMQLCSNKAFILALPGLALILLATARWRPRWHKPVLWMVAGATAGLAFGVVVLVASGSLGVYVDQLRHFSQYASRVDRLSVFPLLGYVIRRGPLQCLLALVAFAFVPPRLMRRRIDETVIAAGFFVFAMVALALNPVPFPYNMTWASVGLLAASTQGWLVVHERIAPRLGQLAPAVLVVVAVVFEVWSAAHEDAFLSIPLDSQRAVAEAAESLTDASEPVLDACGLVVTRPPASRYWMLHGAFMPEYRAGRRETLAAAAARTKPPVIISGYYRWGWLSPAELRAIHAPYVPISPQVWVLGHRGKASFHYEVRRAGRYVVMSVNNAPVRVNGVEQRSGDVVALPEGDVSVDSTEEAMIAWVGPRLTELPYVPDATPLFYGVIF